MHVCNPDVSVLSAVLQVAAVALMRSNMCMEAGPGLGGALLTPKGKETPVICGLLEEEFGKFIPVGLSAVSLGTLDQALCMKPGMSIRSSLLAAGMGTAGCHSAKDTHKKRNHMLSAGVLFKQPLWPQEEPSSAQYGSTPHPVTNHFMACSAPVPPSAPQVPLCKDLLTAVTLGADCSDLKPRDFLSLPFLSHGFCLLLLVWSLS